MDEEQVSYPEAKITDKMIDSMRSTRPWTKLS